MKINEKLVQELQERLEKVEKIANNRADFILRSRVVGNLQVSGDPTNRDSLLVMQCNISVDEIIEITSTVKGYDFGESLPGILRKQACSEIDMSIEEKDSE